MGDEVMASELKCAECRFYSEGAFSCLPEAIRARLDRNKVRHEFGAGDALFHEGLAAESVFCIRSGLVKLFRSWTDGRHYVLGVARAGSLVGHVSAIMDGPFRFGAQAIEPTSACVLGAHLLREMVDTSSPFAAHLLRESARTLQECEDQCLTLALRSVPERTARLLVKLLDVRNGDEEGGDVVPLSLRRIDLADMVGSTQETLSRVLHQMEREGLLALGPRMIRVVDRKRLRAIALGEVD